MERYGQVVERWGHRVERREIEGGRRIELAVGRWRVEGGTELGNKGLEVGESTNGGYREVTGQHEGNVW